MGLLLSGYYGMAIIVVAIMVWHYYCGYYGIYFIPKLLFQIPTHTCIEEGKHVSHSHELDPIYNLALLSFKFPHSSLNT